MLIGWQLPRLYGLSGCSHRVPVSQSATAKLQYPSLIRIVYLLSLALLGFARLQACTSLETNDLQPGINQRHTEVTTMDCTHRRCSTRSLTRDIIHFPLALAILEVCAAVLLDAAQVPTILKSTASTPEYLQYLANSRFLAVLTDKREDFADILPDISYQRVL